MSSELPAPPDAAEFPYAGWVPTVNGRLSFRHVGESRNPTESRYANVTTDTTRLILAFQHRPLSDVFFQRLLHPLLHLEGNFYFAAAAQSSGIPGETEEIHGTIFIFKSKADWKALGRPSIRPHYIDLNDLNNSNHPYRATRIVALYSDSKTRLNAGADISIQFHLFRTGEVFFAAPTYKDTQLRDDSRLYASSHGQDFDKWVADQTYFFLRDITHIHQHHAPSSDTVLILQYRQDDDVRWRRNIVYSLNHCIIRSKRLADAGSLFQAMGMVAYCQAFKAICEERLQGKIPGLPLFNDNTLLTSLRARADERIFQVSDRAIDAQIRISRAANWRVFALTFSALIIAFVIMFVQPTIDSGAEPKLLEISKFISHNLFTILASLVLALLFVWALTQSNWQVRTSTGRDILEFSNVRRVLFISIYLLGGIGIISLTYFLAEPAVADMKKMLHAFWRLINGP